jgi:hypothetical protein
MKQYQNVHQNPSNRSDTLPEYQPDRPLNPLYRTARCPWTLAALANSSIQRIDML